MPARHPPDTPQVGGRRDHGDGRDDRGPLPPAERLRHAERREHLASHTGETTRPAAAARAGPPLATERPPVRASVGYLAAVKLAVARTVPFREVRRAPVTLAASMGSGLPHEPYPPSRWNDPTVKMRPSLVFQLADDRPVAHVHARVRVHVHVHVEPPRVTFV